MLRLRGQLTYTPNFFSFIGEKKIITFTYYSSQGFFLKKARNCLIRIGWLHTGFVGKSHVLDPLLTVNFSRKECPTKVTCSVD